MSGDGLVVRGGAAGVGADLDDLRATAGQLSDAADALLEVSARVAAAAAAPCLLVTAPLSPRTALSAQGRLLSAAAGPTGLGSLAVRLRALAEVLELRARLLDLADRGPELLRQEVVQAGGRALGAGLVSGPGLVGAGLVVGVGGIAWTSARAGPVALDLLEQAAQGELTREELDRRLRQLPPDLRAQLQADLARTGQELLRRAPGLTDVVVAAAPSVLRGAAGPAAGGLPDDQEGLLGLVLAAGGAAGWFRDSRVTATVVRRTADTGPTTGRGGTLRSLAERTQRIDHEAPSAAPGAGAPPGEATGSLVRVRRTVVDGTPHWLVVVPGTRQWRPRSTSDPSDLTSNLELMDDEQAALLDGLADALRAVGVRSTDPVLLVGHSQGGIAAARFAAHPQLRREFRVTHVMTSGAPVGGVPVPRSVQTLSVEHTQDAVARLDGRRNPDLAHWTTVSRQLPRQTLPTTSHRSESYVGTAALLDASADPGVTRWRAGAAPFLTPGGVTYDVVLRRQPADRLR